MRSRTSNSYKTESGFTLLETLVALVITSISLVIVLQSISGSFRTRSLTQKTYEMAQYAESKLDELEVTTEYPPQDSMGKFNDRYDWASSFSPYEENTLQDIEVFWMKVEILDVGGKERSFELERLIMFDRRGEP